jgi:hypothetical protein
MSKLSTGRSDSEKPASSGGSKTIEEFCRDNRISRSFYYKMRNAGIGPGEMRFGSIVRITRAAEAAWQAPGERELQATVAPKLETSAREVL